MKKIAALCFSFFYLCSFVHAQDIKLNEPDKERGLVFMKALSERKSVREFSEKMLSDKDLADLLWATVGQNRNDGKLTAPTAMNKQEIRLFLFTSDAVSEYMPHTHSLRTVASGDHRGLVAGRQEFVKTAPVSLVMVADLDKFGRTDERSRMMACVDAGIVCQNINLFCAAAGLVTVPRATMDNEAIQKLLGLNENQIPVMNNPVGYGK